MSNNSSPKAGAIIAGIVGVTAAAVGAYYLYGHEDAAKNRAKVKGWMLKAKGEVLEELEKAQGVTEGAYMSAVDAVAKKYNQLKSIDPDELAIFIGEMRDHWKGIQMTVETHGKAITKTVKSVAKAPAKKPARKATAKSKK